LVPERGGVWARRLAKAAVANRRQKILFFIT
jgi:hypothetical protein